MRERILVLITLVMFLTAEPLFAACTERDQEALAKTGMSGYEIAKLCGDIKEGTVPREEERVLPKLPDSHGRLPERTDIFQTEVGWCVVAEQAPPGLSCQCRTAHGVYQGVLVRR
jgi:hypothetical protein